MNVLDIDLDRLTVGALRLGDPPPGARSPDGYEFEGGRLVCWSLDMDESAGVRVAGRMFTRATTPQDVRAWLGEPSSDSTGGGGLRWMDYERAGATLALEFDSGGLSCVQLYAEGYA